MNRLKMKQGFTMVELLVVLVIVGILTAVATPVLLANTQRSRASEAVSIMSLVRQAERDFTLQPGGAFFNIAAGVNLQNGLPTAVSAAGAPTPATAGLSIPAGATQFFNNTAFTVAVGGGGGGASGLFTNPPVQGFLITASGAGVVACGAAVPAAGGCAVHAPDVAAYTLEMDNTGRAFVQYAAGGPWTAY